MAKPTLIGLHDRLLKVEQRQAQILLELKQQHDLISDLLSELDQLGSALKMLNDRLEVETEAREQTTLILRDFLRLIYRNAGSPEAHPLRAALPPMGRSLNEYLPDEQAQAS